MDVGALARANARVVRSKRIRTRPEDTGDPVRRHRISSLA